MGIDVTTLLPHKLPMGTLRETALALAEKFRARVRYGHENPDYEAEEFFLVEGEVGSGEALWELMQYIRDEAAHPDSRWLELRQREGTFLWAGNGDGDVTLYRYCLRPFNGISYRWWRFADSAFKKDDFGYLTQERKALAEEAAFWDAREALHFPDSFFKEVGHWENAADWMPWEGLMQKARELLGDELVNLSEAGRRGRAPWPESNTQKSPQMFWDDFSYLPPAPDEVAWHKKVAVSAAFVANTIEKASAAAEEDTNPLSREQRERWYSHLVAQSKTDRIYDLIHEFVAPDFQLNHKSDFVVLRRGWLPEALRLQLSEYLSKKIPPKDYCFQGGDYAILDNYKLTPYLEAARWMSTIEDKQGRRFIELHYNQPSEWSYVSYQRRKERGNIPPAIDLNMQSPETLFGKEESLTACWQLIVSGKDKTLAVAYADGAMEYLSESIQQIIRGDNPLPKEEYGKAIGKLISGFNIPAVAYAWNDLPEKAREADGRYLHYQPLWRSMESVIQPHLELLMAKGWTEYLAWVFSDEGFRKHFLPHYEAYISLLINPHFPLTRMGEVVGIINRVNNVMTSYK